MIEIKMPDLIGDCCNSCYSRENVLQIEIMRTFSGGMFSGKNGYAIMLCPACRDALREALTQEAIERGKSDFRERIETAMEAQKRGKRF